MMKRLISLLMMIAFVAAFAVLPASAGVTSNPRVVDEADLLSDGDEAALAATLEEYSKKNDCDVVFVTVPDLLHGDFSFNGSVEDYADRYYESHGYDKDGVLVLRVLDKGDGGPRIQFSCSGKCMKRLTEDEQDAIIDSIEKDLTGVDSIADQASRQQIYYSVFSTMADGINAKLPPRVPIYMLLLAIAIGFVIAMIIMLVIKGKLKTVALQRGAASYVRPGSMHVTASRDTFLYFTVNRTPRQTGSSGASRTSSSGGSHSGTGRNI